MADYVTHDFIESAPEAALLLLTARPFLGPRAIDRIRSVLDLQIQWDLVLRMAHHHGVASLAYRGLESVGAEEIPPAALQAFRVAARATALQDRFLADELIKVLKLCAASGVDVIPVKGPTLARSVYGGRGLRPYRDLDLLVREQDVSRVTEVLLDDGFVVLKPSTFSSTRHDGFRRFHEITFGKADGCTLS